MTQKNYLLGLKSSLLLLLGSFIGLQADPLEDLLQGLHIIGSYKKQSKPYADCCISSILKNLAVNPKHYSADRKKNKTEKLTTYTSDCKKYGSHNGAIPKHDSTKSTSIVRVATYNIHFWDPNAQTIENVVKELANLGVDVICFQELSGLNTSKERLKKYGYTQTFFQQSKILKKQKARMGIMIAAKKNIAIKEITKGELPIIKNSKGVDEKWDDSYILCELTVNNKKVHLCCAHPTHLSETGRVAQVTWLNNKLNIYKNLIIGADWNALQKSDCQYMVNGQLAWDIIDKQSNFLFKKSIVTGVEDYTRAAGYKDTFELSGIIPTFSHWTGTTIDRFLIYKPEKTDLSVKGSYLYFDSASDHLPVIADIKVS